MLYGYAGCVLRINLSDNEVNKQPLDPQMAEEWIGGRGFVAATLFKELPKDSDPLGPENLFIAATGPLSGHFLPASGKTHFGCKSPATGGYGDSNMGGHWGPNLKYAGYDMLVLTGKAAEPSLLIIDDDEIKTVPAGKYWGMGSMSCEEALKEEYGEDHHVLTIGPAGEKGVRFSCITHDFGRQAGRVGIGAVLGSKNIKAIIVHGTKSLPAYDVEGLFAEGKKAYADVKAKPGFEGWTPEGTAGITDWLNCVGALPTRNFMTSNFSHASSINGAAIVEKLKITDKGCYCCPTPCGKYGKARTGLGDVYVEGPEYETIGLLGSNVALEDINEVAYANYVCDELGLDTISAGVTVSWALECYERGLISQDEMGRPVSFGDLESIVYLLEKTAKREGIGELLSEGVKRASEKVGQGSTDFAIHVKGLEWSGYECRNAPGMMLAYCTSDIGAHHARAWVLGHDLAGSADNVHDLISSAKEGQKLGKGEVHGKSQTVMDSQHLRPAFDLLGICRLQYMELGFEVEHYERLFKLATGRDLSWVNILGFSEKVWQMTRSISSREIKGFGRSMDYPPERFMTEPVPDGPNEGHMVTHDEMNILLDEYYEARGWDKNGIPTAETLKKHGLDFVAETMDSWYCRS